MDIEFAQYYTDIVKLKNKNLTRFDIAKKAVQYYVKKTKNKIKHLCKFLEQKLYFYFDTFQLKQSK